jgi:Zn-dependent M28 family amino/carboxypeptidase
MFRYLISFIVVSLSLVQGCRNGSLPDSPGEGLDAISADSLRRHISVLSADSLFGRKPFTAGEERTIRYLQQQFMAAGLEPGNGDSYLQEVPMVNILATADTTMQVTAPGGDFNLKAYYDYILWTDRTEESVSLDTTDLVFAGYGIVAPEYNWNDYEGLDVKGKVVMVMINDPGFRSGDPALFRGETMTYYGRWTYKFEEAARQGARGCLIIHNIKSAGYGYIVQQNKFNNTRLLLVRSGNEPEVCEVIGWLPQSTANRLFVAAGYDSLLLEQAGKPGFRGMPLNLKLTTGMTVKSDYNKSHNVIGKITGTKRPDEVIIYTAHWDHLGIGKPDEKGDSIYNGAFDNATSTAGLIELARAFNSMKEKPERTVVFLSVTAEEQGLLGSEYYVQHPVYPLEKTVANINMECLSRNIVTKDRTVIGRGQSELEDYLEEVLRKTGGYISDETHPEAGYFYRSDHFSFAKAGVPALYAISGVDVIGKGREYGIKVQNDYRDKNYHRPSDEYDPETWTMEGAVEELKTLFLVGRRLASEERWVEWKPGSEFKAVREAARQEVK